MSKSTAMLAFAVLWFIWGIVSKDMTIANIWIVGALLQVSHERKL